MYRDLVEIIQNSISLARDSSDRVTYVQFHNLQFTSDPCTAVILWTSFYSLHTCSHVFHTDLDFSIPIFYVFFFFFNVP